MNYRLKTSKRHCAFIKIMIIFHLIVAGCVLYVQKGSPVIAFIISAIALSIQRRHKIQRLPLRIAALLCNFSFQPACHAFHALFQMSGGKYR